MTTQDNNQNTKKKSFFDLFRGAKNSANEGCCCNMKIVPKEQSIKESGKGGCCDIKIVPKGEAEEGKGNSGCSCC